METVRFNPSVLKWARERRYGPRMDIMESSWAASWTDVTPELVRSWEKGDAQPTFTQAKRLAEIYKRPLSVFFLDSPPDEPLAPPDQRTLGSETNKELTPEALLVIRKARRIQRVARDLRAELGERAPFRFGKHATTDDASVLGERLRTEMSVSIEDQAKGQKYEEFFEYLRGKIEAEGVITLKSGEHDSFSINDCRAFSFADAEPYLILINNKDTEGAKIFSLVHEFGHLLLREPGICNNFKSFGNKKGRVNEVEVFCNQFAASFLVPAEYVLSHEAIAGRTRIDPDDLEATTERLSRYFKVSRYVILRRLLSLGLITKTAYESKAKAWEEEPLPARRPGGTFSLRTKLLRNGKAFSILVLEAYRQKKISHSVVSDYLDLKTRHLRNYERLVNFNGR